MTLSKYVASSLNLFAFFLYCCENYSYMFFLNRQVCLFLKRGANQHATDEDGKDPLTIAVEAANADIVTL